MYNDQLVYKVVIWAYFGIRLWKEKVALSDSSLLSIYLCYYETILVYPALLTEKWFKLNPSIKVKTVSSFKNVFY